MMTLACRMFLLPLGSRTTLSPGSDDRIGSGLSTNRIHAAHELDRTGSRAPRRADVPPESRFVLCWDFEPRSPAPQGEPRGSSNPIGSCASVCSRNHPRPRHYASRAEPTVVFCRVPRLGRSAYARRVATQLRPNGGAGSRIQEGVAVVLAGIAAVFAAVSRSTRPADSPCARSAPRLHRFPRADPVQEHTVLQELVRGDCADVPPLMSTQERGPSRQSGSHVVLWCGRRRLMNSRPNISRKKSNIGASFPGETSLIVKSNQRAAPLCEPRGRQRCGCSTGAEASGGNRCASRQHCATEQHANGRLLPPAPSWSLSRCRPARRASRRGTTPRRSGCRP